MHWKSKTVTRSKKQKRSKNRSKHRSGPRKFSGVFGDKCGIDSDIEFNYSLSQENASKFNPAVKAPVKGTQIKVKFNSDSGNTIVTGLNGQKYTYKGKKITEFPCYDGPGERIVDQRSLYNVDRSLMDFSKVVKDKEFEDIMTNSYDKNNINGFGFPRK